MTYSVSAGTIGKGGGTVSITDPNSKLNGVIVMIPESALEENTLIQVSQSNTSSIFYKTPDDIVVSLQPHGTKFLKPIEVTIPYTGSNIKDAVVINYDPDNLNLEFFTPIFRDSEKSVVTFETEHFSNFCVGDYIYEPEPNQYIIYKESYRIKNGINDYLKSIPTPQYVYLHKSSEFLGWIYNYSGYPKDGKLYGYPHIQYGLNPCDKPDDPTSSTTELPCDINSISSLYTEFDATFNYTKNPLDIDLVIDVWLTNSLTPKEANITGEIMIFDYKGKINIPGPPGAAVKKNTYAINIDGIPYDLYVYDHDTFPGCEIYNFMPLSTQASTSDRKIDILKFINVLKAGFTAGNLIQPDQKYLSSITFGNEIWSGSGLVTINEFSVTLLKKTIIPTTPISDRDGNSYNTVTIGSQTWMAENLKTTKFNDGTPIQIVTSNSVWANMTTPAYCWYNNNEATNKNTYGALYNWYAVNTGKLCPTGWHVPSHQEFTILRDHLGGEAVAGGKLKEEGLAHWKSPNTGAINTSLFTAVPSGTRTGFDGPFYYLGEDGHYWSSTSYSTGNAYHWYTYYNTASFQSGNTLKDTGYAIRCVKN